MFCHVISTKSNGRVQSIFSPPSHSTSPLFFPGLFSIIHPVFVFPRLTAELLPCLELWVVFATTNNARACPCHLVADSSSSVGRPRVLSDGFEFCLILLLKAAKPQLLYNFLNTLSSLSLIFRPLHAYRNARAHTHTHTQY